MFLPGLVVFGVAWGIAFRLQDPLPCLGLRSELGLAAFPDARAKLVGGLLAGSSGQLVNAKNTGPSSVVPTLLAGIKPWSPVIGSRTTNATLLTPFGLFVLL